MDKSSVSTLQQVHNQPQGNISHNPYSIRLHSFIHLKHAKNVNFWETLKLLRMIQSATRVCWKSRLELTKNYYDKTPGLINTTLGCQTPNWYLPFVDECYSYWEDGNSNCSFQFLSALTLVTAESSQLGFSENGRSMTSRQFNYLGSPAA